MNSLFLRFPIHIEKCLALSSLRGDAFSRDGLGFTSEVYSNFVVRSHAQQGMLTRSWMLSLLNTEDVPTRRHVPARKGGSLSLPSHVFHP
jgi:hypothetical protein